MFVKKYDMELYCLQRDHLVSYLDKAPSNIELIDINDENLEANKSYYPSKYRSWKRSLKKGEKGVFAVCDGKAIGYGWLKKKGTKDPFYRFGKSVAYLAGFYVSSDFRGQNIYPALISQLILSSPEYDKFYISIYTSNVASRNGLLKVGFELIRSLTFIRIRALKVTLNKYKITL